MKKIFKDFLNELNDATYQEIAKGTGERGDSRGKRISQDALNLAVRQFIGSKINFSSQNKHNLEINFHTFFVEATITYIRVYNDKTGIAISIRHPKQGSYHPPVIHVFKSGNMYMMDTGTPGYSVSLETDRLGSKLICSIFKAIGVDVKPSQIPTF